jgi:hypothetical protein
MRLRMALSQTEISVKSGTGLRSVRYRPRTLSLAYDIDDLGLNGLAIATNYLLGAIARSKATVPALEILVDLATFCISEFCCHSVP